MEDSHEDDLTRARPPGVSSGPVATTYPRSRNEASTRLLAAAARLAPVEPSDDELLTNLVHPSYESPTSAFPEPSSNEPATRLGHRRATHQLREESSSTSTPQGSGVKRRSAVNVPVTSEREEYFPTPTGAQPRARVSPDYGFDPEPQPRQRRQTAPLESRPYSPARSAERPVASRPMTVTPVAPATAPLPAHRAEPSSRHSSRPHDSARRDSRPYDSRPHDSARHDSARHDSRPYDSRPYDSRPHDSARHDSRPHDSARHDSRPYDSARAHGSARAHDVAPYRQPAQGHLHDGSVNSPWTFPTGTASKRTQSPPAKLAPFGSKVHVIGASILLVASIAILIASAIAARSSQHDRTANAAIQTVTPVAQSYAPQAQMVIPPAQPVATPVQIVAQPVQQMMAPAQPVQQVMAPVQQVQQVMAPAQPVQQVQQVMAPAQPAQQVQQVMAPPPNVSIRYTAPPPPAPAVRWTPPKAAPVAAPRPAKKPAGVEDILSAGLGQ